MFWRMYAGHNCTNYAAYRMVRSGMPNVRPWSGPGNAEYWGTSVPNLTDSVPRVGAIAWWRANAGPAGSSGHVAYIQRVVSANEIVVSQDSWGGDFSWASITRLRRVLAQRLHPLQRREVEERREADRFGDAQGRCDADGVAGDLETKGSQLRLPLPVAGERSAHRRRQVKDLPAHRRPEGQADLGHDESVEARLSERLQEVGRYATDRSGSGASYRWQVAVVDLPIFETSLSVDCQATMSMILSSSGAYFTRAQFCFSSSSWTTLPVRLEMAERQISFLR